jgi:hypothetical protein
MSPGLHRSEFTAGEIADEMEKERKYLQLTTADYLIKVNEVRTKKSVDLLQHLLEYYKAQYRYGCFFLSSMHTPCSLDIGLYWAVKMLIFWLPEQKEQICPKVI